MIRRLKKQQKTNPFQGMHANSSFRFRFRHSLLMNYVLLVLWFMSFTWSGNVVSLSSRSSSAYVRIVLRERRRNSSLKFWDVPTRDERDMVTCIFTLAKFCNRDVVMVFQQPGDSAISVLWSWHPPPDLTEKRKLKFCWKGCLRAVIRINLVLPNFITW